jgi:hypothetical protein
MPKPGNRAAKRLVIRFVKARLKAATHLAERDQENWNQQDCQKRADQCGDDHDGWCQDSGCNVRDVRKPTSTRTHTKGAREAPTSRHLLGGEEHSRPVFPTSSDHPGVIAEGYFCALDGDSEDRILRPARVYCPKKRTVAIPSNVTGIHMPPSCANCKVI